MKGFFAPLAIKIFAGVTVLLLVALGIAYLLLSSAWGTIETQRTAIAECNAARAVQNEAIARAGQESQRQRQAFASALEAGQANIAAAQGRVTVIRQSARPNGCRTTPEILGAGL